MIYAFSIPPDQSARKLVAKAIDSNDAERLAELASAGTIVHIMDAREANRFHCIYCGARVNASKDRRPAGNKLLKPTHFTHIAQTTTGSCLGESRVPKILNPLGQICNIQLGMPVERPRQECSCNLYCHLGEVQDPPCLAESTFRPQVWLIKARKIRSDGSPGWHWSHYFNSRSKQYPWGGPEWVRSRYSKKLIEGFRPGDLLVAYQVDDDQFGRCILGFTRTPSGGKRSLKSRSYDAFTIAGAEEALKFNVPLTIQSLYARRIRPSALGRGTQGTVFPLSVQEFEQIVRAATDELPGQRAEIAEWLADAGYSQQRPPVALIPVKLSKKTEQFETDCEQLLQEAERLIAGRDDVFVRHMFRRMVRQDAPLIRAVKRKYGYRCQFPGCRAEIVTRHDGLYCEVAHLTPVHSGGQSTRLNLVVLCPNHHKALDYGQTTIHRSTKQEIVGTLNGKSFRILR